MSDERRPRICVCCGDTYQRHRDIDPWEGRLDGYCWDCALMRCDAEGCCQRNDRDEPTRIERLKIERAALDRFVDQMQQLSDSGDAGRMLEDPLDDLRAALAAPDTNGAPE